jgi:hypothetical protein
VFGTLFGHIQNSFKDQSHFMECLDKKIKMLYHKCLEIHKKFNNMISFQLSFKQGKKKLMENTNHVLVKLLILMMYDAHTLDIRFV